MLAPYNRVVAEILSWPLASERAWELVTVQVKREAPRRLEPVTRQLVEGLRQSLMPCAGGLSEELFEQLLDGLWFRTGQRDPRDGSTAVNLADYLCAIAHDTLICRGREVALQADGQWEDIVGRWRYLSLMLPPDLLVAAKAQCDPVTDGVSLDTPPLRRLLERSVAETHMHLGAAFSFAQLWTGLMQRESLGMLDPKSFNEGAPFGSGELFSQRLVCAGIARTLLAAFLAKREQSHNVSQFHQFMGSANKQGLASICSNIESDPERLVRRYQAALGALIRPLGPNAASLASLRILYRRLLGPNRTSDCKSPSLADFIRKDPLSHWLIPAPGRALPETRLTWRCLRYLQSSGASDVQFATVFWQYQRVRCLLYRYLVQQPGTAGLGWFRRFYSRISSLSRPLEKFEAACALDLQSSGVHLAALEGRIAPKQRWYQVSDRIKGFARQAQRHQAPSGQSHPELGLVLHLLKNWCVDKQPKRQHADPGWQKRRYSHWFDENRRAVQATVAALDAVPELLLLLRGVDVANFELAIPVWIIAPLLHHLRHESTRIAGKMAARQPAWRVDPLRLTYHAGEEWRRMPEGLRQITDLLDCKLLQAGDRIGHGLVLGWDPAQWGRSSVRVWQPREERLEDLLWELSIYKRGELSADAARVEFLRGQVMRLRNEIYGSLGALRNVDDILAQREERYDNNHLIRRGFGVRVGDPNDLTRSEKSHDLLHAYLHDRLVYARGQEAIEVAVSDSELLALQAAQSWLRAKLSRQAITIEGNPSSNQLIGELQQLEHHPAFSLQPLRGTTTAARLPLSINTDDPITFATRLADEYAYVLAALVRTGASMTDALAWLECRRSEGFDSRFTLAASADKSALAVLGSNANAR